LESVDDDALLSPEVALPLLDEGLDDELGEALLPEDGLSLGVLLEPPPLGDVVLELMLPPLGDASELDPEELSPEDEAPALAPPELPLDAPPAPCAQAADAKASMAAVTAALMSFRFIFSSSRVGMEMDCGRGNARTMPSPQEI
jgi:hypothetical protein